MKNLRRELPYPSYLSAREPRHRASIALTVPFADCDAMGVAWHGSYLRWCERAREALGRQLGWGVAELAAAGLYAPVVQSQLRHHRPARPGEALQIDAALYPTAQPRLYHRYRIRSGGELLCQAETDQVLTDRGFTLLLRQPQALAALIG
jgi:acyl-CoA thioester hydrolase